MSNVLNRLEECLNDLSEAVRDLKRKEVKSYPVVTPVSGTGYILFDGNTQRMCTSDRGKIRVDGVSSSYVDMSENYVWIPVERKELKAGDIAYRSYNNNNNNKNFSTLSQVCAIVDSDYYWYVNECNDISQGNMNYNFWYKLTPKDETNA